MDEIQQLATGKLIIYVASRLFDFADKLAAAQLEEACYLGVKQALDEKGFELTEYPIYLPYRDTNEAELHGLKDLFKKIYDDDIARMNKLFGMVGYLNDPSKDDGVCMEFGYAFGLGRPTLAVNTEIQKYTYKGYETFAFSVDPVLQRMIGEIIHVFDMPPSQYKVTTNINKMLNLAQEYIQRLSAGTDKVHELVKKACCSMIYNPDSYIPGKIHNIEGRDIFIDFIGNRDEWSREYSDRLQIYLSDLGISSYVGNRFDPRLLDTLKNTDSIDKIGEQDITKLLASGLVVIGGDGPEVDAGSAALLGYAKAVGKRIILYYSGILGIVEGEAYGLRNLMIEYSADYIVNSLQQLKELISNLFCK